MTERLFEQVLEAYAPAGGRDDLDWADVLRRAGGARDGATRGRLTRRAVLVAAVAAALLLFTLATPAFGLRQVLIDLVTYENHGGREDVRFSEGTEAPLVTKRRFAELGRAGPWENFRVQAARTRRFLVDTGQRERVLMLAPTSRGGFCYRLQGAGGQCQRNSRPPAEMPEATWWYRSRQLSGERVLVRGVTGTVLDERIVRLSLEFNDGHDVDLPFVWVSAPINAGFFAYEVPRDRQEEPRIPIALAGYDARGNVVYRKEAIEYPQPIPEVSDAPRRRPRLRPDPPAFLLPPFRTASDRGATIKVGQAGVVLLDVRQLEPQLRAVLVGRLVYFRCFGIVTRFGATSARGYSTHGVLGETAGSQLRADPLDGCDVEVITPDGRDLRPILEFAFTETGRRYFVDRTAARDLAVLVSYVRRIRTLSRRDFASALWRRYGHRLVRLAHAGGRPLLGKLGYFAGEDSVTFVRLSPTGRRLFVELEGGRVVRRNIRWLAPIR